MKHSFGYPCRHSEFSKCLDTKTSTTTCTYITDYRSGLSGWPWAMHGDSHSKELAF